MKALLSPEISVANYLVGVRERLVVTAKDSSANTNPNRKDMIPLRVKSDSGAQTEIILTETGMNTGIFTGMLRLTPNKKLYAGDFEVMAGDLIELTYEPKRLVKTSTHRKEFSKTVEVGAWDPSLWLIRNSMMSMIPLS